VDTILSPIYWLISWIMIGWHNVLSLVLDPDSGVTWALTIVGLVIIIRILLIPLFVRQIKSQRTMQMIQPEVRALQAKYKHDRERMSQEMMQLYKDRGTSPFGFCLPLLPQIPIFFGLFRVLNGISLDPPKALGAFAYPQNTEIFQSLAESTLFGVPLAASFSDQPNLVVAVMVVMMSASQFFTQRQLTRKNMPQSALEGPFAQQQKIMLYLFPLIFLVTGVFFPLGVIIYWLTTNLWTAGQQFYVIRRNPTPGSQAAVDQHRRQVEKARRKGLPEPPPPEAPSAKGQPSKKEGPPRSKPPTSPGTAGPGTKPPSGPPSGPTPGRPRPPASSDGSSHRSQPKRTTRSQRKKK
jgi:YidC/Oxa1 family membrane protein insertase